MTRKQLLGRLDSVKVPKQYYYAAERLRSFCDGNYENSLMVFEDVDSFNAMRILLRRLGVLYSSFVSHSLYCVAPRFWLINVVMTRK